MLVQLRSDDFGAFHVLEDFVDVPESHHGADGLQSKREFQGLWSGFVIGTAGCFNAHLEQLQGLLIG